MKLQNLLSLVLCHLVFSEGIKHEQVHLSGGSDESEIIVTWVTLQPLQDSPIVEFGFDKTQLTSNVRAESSHFEQSGANFTTHRALIAHLKPVTKYYYRVGSQSSGWSSTFEFQTFANSTKWFPRLALYGDLGFENADILPFLSKDVENKLVDAIFHIGDMAYNLHDKHGEQGHNFMRAIEKVSSKVPYFTCPGNHEEEKNFTHYDARFSMLGDRNNPNKRAPLSHRINNHFHSVDIGPLHIIMFSSEFYFKTKFGFDQIKYQYEWLKADLKKANEKRSERPWIIAMMHRPMYCLNFPDYTCDYSTLERPDMRTGIHMYKKKDSPREYAIEPLFYKHGVDLVVSAHEHLFWRLLPMYNFTILSGTNISNPYDNPNGITYITTGSAGSSEGHAPINPDSKDKKWLVYHNYDFGFTRLTMRDRLHLVLEQTSDPKGGTIIDKVDLIKKQDKPRWLL